MISSRPLIAGPPPEPPPPKFLTTKKYIYLDSLHFFLPTKKNGINASICIGREIQCLPYVGFSHKRVDVEIKKNSIVKNSTYKVGRMSGKAIVCINLRGRAAGEGTGKGSYFFKCLKFQTGQ